MEGTISFWISCARASRFAEGKVSESIADCGDVLKRDPDSLDALARPRPRPCMQQSTASPRLASPSLASPRLASPRLASPRPAPPRPTRRTAASFLSWSPPPPLDDERTTAPAAVLGPPTVRAALLLRVQVMKRFASAAVLAAARAAALDLAPRIPRQSTCPRSASPAPTHTDSLRALARARSCQLERQQTSFSCVRARARARARTLCSTKAPARPPTPRTPSSGGSEFVLFNDLA